MRSPSPKPAVRREITELSLLLDISRILDSSLDLREVIGPVLRIIDEHVNLRMGALSLLNRATGEISMETAYGLSEQQQRRGRYKVGEGVIGRVIQSGVPAVIPRVSEEPGFLNKTGVLADDTAREFSFICVPIKLGNRVIGALSTGHLFREPVSLDDDVRLLSIIASMISQAVKLRQAASEERERLQEENTRLLEELADRFRPSNIIGNSEAMQEVYGLIGQVCTSDATVLIRGETGTGKDLVAHAIHYNSPRAKNPFIKVNCAALPESVIESELFGHERGAFTGAVSSRKGRFELANQGTLFLDEIGDLSPTIQVKLLRVLQDHEFERVGGVSTIKCDVRVIAATNRNLEQAMASELFRADLYYRLNVFPIHIPPLRERKTDILLLSDYFAEHYKTLNGKDVRRISTPAIDMLMSYHWPGNVRELENCVERAVLLSNDDVIHGHHLPPTLQSAEASGTSPRAPLQSALDALERELIEDALKWSRGNMARASRRLGVTERIMGLRIDRYQIDYRRYRR